MLKKRILVQQIQKDSFFSEALSANLMCWESRHDDMYDKYLFDNLTGAIFDLLILQTTQKIYELEHNTKPVDIQTLVNCSILERIPEDAFDEEMAAYRRTPEGLFYSIGPDKEDQQAQTYYDPTNGSASPGDFWLRAFE
jgi:hypothetical protein